MPDAELKTLMQNLEESLNEAISESAVVIRVIREIREAGYDIELVIDATIGSSPAMKVPAGIAAPDPVRIEPVRLRITPEDAKFLKSLKIAIESDSA
ncbi:MAG: hypothetical protein FJW35_00605 [Acidobacteria bacterium]|nr:hypothetical protein [Acidobacteriota bacterium]